MIAATEQGHEEVAAYLIDRWMAESGADDSDEFGTTALMFAAQIGDLIRIKELIDNGADIYAETKVGFNAFLLAVHGGHLEVLRHFLELGSDINHQTAVGSTALMFASYLGDLDTVHLLLEKGADVDAQTKIFQSVGGYTALMAAAYTGHLDVVRLLVENGADIDITDVNSKDGIVLGYRERTSRSLGLFVFLVIKIHTPKRRIELNEQAADPTPGAVQSNAFRLNISKKMGSTSNT